VRCLRNAAHGIARTCAWLIITSTDRMAAPRKSDQRRDDLCGAEFINVHSAFRETDNFRFQFLLSFAPGHEFLHCGGHYFFDRPAILIRDLSQQSHRPLREGIHRPAAYCEGCDVFRRFRDRFHAVRFALLSAGAQETSAEQLCD
jgi:hypothetical protein